MPQDATPTSIDHNSSITHLEIALHAELRPGSSASVPRGGRSEWRRLHRQPSPFRRPGLLVRAQSKTRTERMRSAISMRAPMAPPQRGC